jgi:hypothetical protein
MSTGPDASADQSSPLVPDASGGMNGGDAGSDGSGVTPQIPVAAPTVLWTFLLPYDSPIWLGGVGARVYFSLYTVAIESLPSAGGVPPSLVAPASTTLDMGVGLYVTNGFAFDSTYVYWSESAGGPTSWIKRAPLDGGTTQLLASPAGFIAGVAVDSGTLYWIAQNQGTVFSVPVAGGTPTVVASGLNTPASIVIHAGIIYMTDAAGDIMSVPTGGGTVTTLLQGPGLPPNVIEVADFSPALAVDDNNIYFSQTYAPEQTIAKMSLTGGTMTVLAKADPVGIAVDANNLYWIDGNTVDEVPIAGGAVKVLASNQTAAAGPYLDDTSVYWGNFYVSVSCEGCPPPHGGNSVMKIAK